MTGRGARHRFARLHVGLERAMKALGGQGTPNGAVAWLMLGEGLFLRAAAERLSGL